MRIKQKCFLIIMMVLLLVGSGFALSVSATESTSYTFTKTSEGDWITTQDAYVTSRVLFQDQQFQSPQDITFQNDSLYIADTGNARVVVYNIRTEQLHEIVYEEMQSPTGIFVLDDGTFYVADNTAKAIFHFSSNGELIKRFGRPTTVTFGKKTRFVPSKIAVNNLGILYVVSEGAYDGIIQIDQDNTFLGYYGYNNNPMSFSEYLQDLFFTEQQKSQLFNRVPLSFKNIALDKSGITYTITQGAEGNALKKHDISGQNRFDTQMDDEDNFVAVSIGAYGQIYAATETGLLYEYDTDGNMLFSFGGTASANERAGLFTVVSGMTTDPYGNIYVLDSERGIVHIFCPTDFAESVHKAMDSYNNGDYNGSLLKWKELSVISGKCQIVENGIANCLFQRKDYKGAAKYYKLALNRKGYSDSYWQIRKEQISIVIPWVFLGLLLLWGLKTWGKKKGNSSRKYAEQNRFLDCVYQFTGTLKHPINTFYDIRCRKKGTMVSATVIYVATYIVFVCNFVFKGFVLSFHTLQNTSLFYVSALFVAPVVLFLISNFFVGEINESEATWRSIYISCAYVTAPFTIIMPFVIALSHFMTQAEGRLLGIVTIAIYIWVAVLLLLAMKEIHAYTVGQLIKNLLLTVFLMAVIIFACSIIGMLADQLVKFIVSVIGEVKYHVA